MTCSVEDCREDCPGAVGIESPLGDATGCAEILFPPKRRRVVQTRNWGGAGGTNPHPPFHLIM